MIAHRSTIVRSVAGFAQRKASVQVAVRPTARRGLNLTPCRAAPDEEKAAAPAPEAPKVEGAAAPDAETPKKAEPAPVPMSPMDKGDGLSLVTGAISLLCGAGYLYIVSFFNQRGVDMIPPPPEAFGP
eukprot:gene11467-34181_t